MSSVTVESTRFGTLELPDSELIEFPEGLIGLGGSHYALICTDDEGAFSWLQSAEDPALALPVTNPWTFFSDYELELSDEDAGRTEIPDSGAQVWVTVRAGAALEDFTANLRAPIVVWNGRGHQVINEAAHAPVRAPLFPGTRDRAA